MKTAEDTLSEVAYNHGICDSYSFIDRDYFNSQSKLDIIHEAMREYVKELINGIISEESEDHNIIHTDLGDCISIEILIKLLI